ncbi:sulfotransferase family protein [Actibacterium pelagium]|uniref:Sulfotransferase family protein n=1 Tax=Actibacterium pelagium TaxID=2029103 RepID=A0A917EKE5_9RHOB|nr:sulfotransferase [Actibacterium pelagium]GGE56975.1 hypothetical protein GCM10011517_25930 [Actibacterium pelagium]
MRNDSSPTRVFVVGCARSGTTLAQRLISERLGLYSLPETRFFANLIGNVEPRMFPQTQQRRPAVRDLRSRLREVLRVSTGMEWQTTGALPAPQRKGRVGMALAAADFVNGMDQLAAENGCSGWLEKTPIHVHYVPQILRYVPGAWVIHVIRGPKQTVASIRDAAQRYPDPWAQIFTCVERAVDNWNASMQDSARAVGLPRQLFLSYETLAQDPEPVLRSVEYRLGLQQMSEPTYLGSGLAEPREVWKSAAISGKVRQAQSKWTLALSAEEREMAEGMIHAIPRPLANELSTFTKAIA